MKATNGIPFASFMNQMTEMEKSAQKITALAQSALDNSFTNYDKMLKNICNSMTASLKALSQIDLGNSITPALQAMSQSITAVNQLVNIDSLGSILSSAVTTLSDVGWYSELDFAIPILEEELKNEPEPIKEIPHSIRERKSLTFEQLCTLLGIILSLISLLIALLPNPQLEELLQQQEALAKQNNTQIEQSNRIIELLEQQTSEKNETDLEDYVKGLANAGNCIVSEIQAHISQDSAEQSQDAVDVADDSIGNAENLLKPSIDQPKSNSSEDTNCDGIP